MPAPTTDEYNLEGKTVIRFDGPPGPEAGRFVDVERDGASINYGKWVQDGKDWLLVLESEAGAIQEAVRILMEAFEADPIAVTNLVTHRVECNQALADHPTIQIRGRPDEPYTLGALGLLNGILEPLTGQRVGMIFDPVPRVDPVLKTGVEDTPLKGFKVYEPPPSEHAETIKNASQEILDSTDRSQGSYLDLSDTPENRKVMKFLGMEWSEGVPVAEQPGWFRFHRRAGRTEVPTQRG